MDHQDFSYTPISKEYILNYLFGIPNIPGSFLKVKFFMTNDGFLFDHAQFKLFIPYKQVENFEILKGAGLQSGVSGLAYETLFQITYINQFEQISTARFEMTGNFGITGLSGRQAECHSILDFLKNNNINSKFKRTAVPQGNISESVLEDPIYQIEKLGELLEKGVITNEEFNEKKSKLLSKI